MDADTPAAKRARKQTGKAETSVQQAKQRLPGGRVSVGSAGRSNQMPPTNTGIPLPESRILPSVALSLFDKASQLVLSDDQLVCYGCEGGYRMVRATHGVHFGSYFWEAEILPGQDADAHVRIGWSTREGELQGPVGYDKHSYAYRDLEGSWVHDSVRVDDVADSFGVGDIVGCFIQLSEDIDSNKVVFFKNGVEQGVAYSGREVPSAVYFPALSLFKRAAVRVNFGPTFIIRPETTLSYLPVSELQPFNPEDRKHHELRILSIRKSRESEVEDR